MKNAFHVFSLTLLCTIFSARADKMDDFFDDMSASLKAAKNGLRTIQMEAEQQAHNFRKRMKNWSASFDLPTYTIKETTEDVIITLDLPKTDPDSIQSNLEQEKLLITIPHESKEIEIAITSNTFNIASRYKQESTKKDGELEGQCYNYGSSQHLQSLPNTIALDKVSLEHSADDETLSIKLPKTHPTLVSKKIDIIKK